MLYKDFVKEMHSCPFCATKPEEAVAHNDLAALIAPLAPYGPRHLLVIPRRHAEHYLDLTADELGAIDELIRKGMQALEKLGISDYSVLARSGDGIKVGKSVPHMHFHIVPGMRLGTVDRNGDERGVLSPAEIALQAAEIRAALP